MKRFLVGSTLAVFGIGLLSACQQSMTMAFQPTPSDVVSVNVGDDTILVGGSDTYCPTRKAKLTSRTGVTVTLRPCSPGGAAQPQSRQAGLLMVNILNAQELATLADEDGLHGYFTSPEGRIALSNDGDPRSVEILGTLQEDSVFYTHTRHASGPIVPDIDNVRWRGFFVVRDRLVSISILSFTDQPIPDGIVFSQLSAFAKRMQQLNP